MTRVASHQIPFVGWRIFFSGTGDTSRHIICVTKINKRSTFLSLWINSPTIVWILFVTIYKRKDKVSPFQRYTESVCICLKFSTAGLIIHLVFVRNNLCPVRPPYDLVERIRVHNLWISCNEGLVTLCGHQVQKVSKKLLSLIYGKMYVVRNKKCPVRPPLPTSQICKYSHSDQKMLFLLVDGSANQYKQLFENHFCCS